jgi:hypothetical protein
MKKAQVMICIGIAVIVILCYALFAGESASKVLSSRIGQEVNVTFSVSPPSSTTGMLTEVDEGGILLVHPGSTRAVYIPMHSIIGVDLPK